MTKKGPKSFHSSRTLFFVLKRENFFYILGITAVILLGGATFLFLVEHKVNKSVGSIGDAIYWA
ncbi:MAG: hypothetical protein V1908_04440, partial [Candidatus Peregrinibacteria bacterium]